MITPSPFRFAAAFVLATVHLWSAEEGSPRTGRPIEVRPPEAVEVRRNKAAKTALPFKTIGLANLVDFHPTTIPLDDYGGRHDRMEKSTGFFRVQKIADRWHLIDPLGARYLNIGANTVKVGTPPENPQAFAKKFTDRRGWAVKTRADLATLGFNSLGCWSDAAAFAAADQKIPSTPQWNFMGRFASSKKMVKYEYGHTGFVNECIPVFDPDFEPFCEREAKALAAAKDDPWILGHFSDNELPFQHKGMIRKYLRNPESDAGHQAARAWLAERGISEDRITVADDAAFTAKVIDRYFSVVGKAIRRNDPNHLFLGARFHGFVLSQDETFTAVAKHVDVVSVNYYGRWTPDQVELDHWATLSGRPLLITEWYAKGDDAGMDDTMGAGFSVATQADRGAFYENFTIGLLRNRNCVGWHWFRWTDDVSKTPANKGVYNGAYEPYEPLAKSMAAINTVAYALQDHLDGAVSPNLPDRRNEVAERKQETRP